MIRNVFVILLSLYSSAAIALSCAPPVPFSELVYETRHHPDAVLFVGEMRRDTSKPISGDGCDDSYQVPLLLTGRLAHGNAEMQSITNRPATHILSYDCLFETPYLPVLPMEGVFLLGQEPSAQRSSLALLFIERGICGEFKSAPMSEAEDLIAIWQSE